MLLSVSVWSGRAGDMDPSLVTLFCWLSALIALPTVVYAGEPFYASALSALKGRRLNMTTSTGFLRRPSRIASRQSRATPTGSSNGSVPTWC